MDKEHYLHILQNLQDKLESIKTVGTSASRIHDINVDISITTNWLYLLSLKDYIPKYERIDKAIKRIENDLISFVYPERKDLIT